MSFAWMIAVVWIVVVRPAGAASTFDFVTLTDINQTAVSNQRVVLPCSPLFPGPVRWCFHKTTKSECDEVAFNGRIINGHSVYYELNGSTVIVKSATNEQAGIYLCIEENGQGNLHRIRLTVTRPGTVSTPPSPSVNPDSIVNCNYTSVHHGDGNAMSDQDCSYQKAVLFAVIIIVLSSAGSVVIALLVMRRNLRGTSEANSTKQELQPLLNDGDLEDIKKFIANACTQRKQSCYLTRHPVILVLTHYHRMLATCTTAAVDHISGLQHKLDAIVGMHGFDSAGSVFATAISQRLQLPLILLVKSERQPAESDETTSVTHFNSRYDKKMIMQLELLDDHAKGIKNVVIVDAEIVSGKSMLAAVQGMEDRKLEVLRCVVIVDVKTCESRVPIKPEVFSLFTFDG